MRIKKVCETCGSERVWRDANAAWDEENQCWDLLNMFQHEWCDDCDAETYIVDQEVN